MLLSRKHGPDQSYAEDRTPLGGTREEALRLWTIESAYFLGAEEDRGSIEVGKLADLAVLSGDPMSVSDEELKSLTAELTMLGGEVVHGSLEQ
ncbi:amidohydrolase family protein [Paracoccus sp. S-4012]|uniref:amidohydrolase family protein n=1 Tax=Paracoccus sp. S-4012 TaxID=2665648 RepID=UPI0012B15DD4|nr:amidohydrolase family protein [Paracoccus sp. S-4012]MRX50427.1 amidohydrolase family protein [Paracoccus sp. S-4012]